MLALTVNLASCVLVNSTSFQTDTNQAQKNLSKRKNSINTMYFLGDSLLDTGGFIEVIHSANEKLKKNSLINTFFTDKLEQISALKLPNFYYGNSFSNGPVISENLTDKLNIPIKSGWDLNLNILDLINIKTSSIGNNYAFSGSQAYYSEQDDKTIRNQLVNLMVNSPNNVDEIIKVLFKQILNQFALVKQADALIKHHANNIKENDLFLIQIGGNDIGQLANEIQNLKRTSNNQNIIDLHITQYLNNSVTNIETTISNLVEKKAKKIIVTNCVDVSKTPYFLKFPVQENKIVFDLVKKYNTIWNKKINNLQVKYPHLIKKYDAFNVCNKLIKQMKAREMIVDVSASRLDFETIFEKMFMGNKNLKFFDYTDPRINNYFFIDNSHPTKEIHRLVAEEIFKLAWNW